jgi:hypothetical protein
MQRDEYWNGMAKRKHRPRKCWIEQDQRPKVSCNQMSFEFEKEPEDPTPVFEDLDAYLMPGDLRKLRRYDYRER